MPGEKEFLERRLRIVQENLDSHSRFDVDEKGGFHFRLGPSPHVEHDLLREAHLLEKLDAQVVEGKVKRTLDGWRKYLAEKLRAHRDYYRDLQAAFDAWRQLPLPTRIEIPEPPYPPELEVTDVQGNIWIVDERLLSVPGRHEVRLTKWMENDE
jgi:hypothetical protein